MSEESFPILNSGEKSIQVVATEYIPKEKKVQKGRNTSIFSSCVHFVNVSIGAGILGFGFANRINGLFSSLIVEILVIICQMFTLSIIIRCSFDKGGVSNFLNLVEIYFGLFWTIICEINILCLCIGGLCVYLAITSEYIKSVLMGIVSSDLGLFVFNDWAIISFCAVFLCFPLILLREMRFLVFTSCLSLIGIFYIVIYVTTFGIIHLVKFGVTDSVRKVWFINVDLYPKTFYPYFFLALPIKCFAYSQQFIICEISYEIKNGSAAKANFVQIFSLIVCFIINFFVGFFSFVTFGDGVSANLIDDYPRLNVFSDIARLLVGVNLIFSFPLVFFVGRNTIVSIYNKLTKKTQHEMKEKESVGFIPYLTITIVMFFVILLITIFVPQLECLFGVSGAISCSMMMFFFPSIFAYGVMRKRSKNLLGKGFWIVTTIGLLLLWAFFTITGTVAAVFQYLNSCAHFIKFF